MDKDYVVVWVANPSGRRVVTTVSMHPLTLDEAKETVKNSQHVISATICKLVPYHGN